MSVLGYNSIVLNYFIIHAYLAYVKRLNIKC